MQSTEAELDQLFDTIDDHFLAGNFAAVDLLIRNVDVGSLSLELLVGWLSITLCAKDKLEERVALCERVIKHVTRFEPPERVERLFRGLL